MSVKIPLTWPESLPDLSSKVRKICTALNNDKGLIPKTKILGISPDSWCYYDAVPDGIIANRTNQMDDFKGRDGNYALSLFFLPIFILQEGGVALILYKE